MTDNKNAIYAESVPQQRQAVPGIYGDVDLSILPERYISDPRVREELSMRFTRLSRVRCLIHANFSTHLA